MNIFNKVALQGLMKSRARTCVTIIGIILSAAMITAVTTFGISLLDYMTNGAVQRYGSWHLGFLDVSPSFIEETLDDEEIAQTAILENIGYAKLEGSQNPDKPYFFINGYEDEALSSLSLQLVTGRLPQNSHEILISSSVSANGGVQYVVGDMIELTLGNRISNQKLLTQQVPYRYELEQFVPREQRTYTVVGIYQRPPFEERTAPGYTVLTKADHTADTFQLFVQLKNPYEVHRYARTKDNPYLLNDNVLRFKGLSEDRIFNTLLYAVGSIVILIIMIGSVFLIYNTFNISLNERTHQFGILMSVGATEKQLRSSVLFEGLCLGLVSIPIGMLLGIGSISIVLSIVEKQFENILYVGVPLTVTLSIPILVLSVIISFITILISAYIPARKAARIPVMECIRQTNDIKMDTKEIKTSQWIERVYGLEGMLALKNFKRNKKRYLSIILSLVLSIVLFISVNAFVIDLKQVSERAIVFTTYDVGFATKDMNDAEMIALYNQFKTLDTVEASGYQALIDYQCTVKASDFTQEYRNQAGLQSPDERVECLVDVQFIDDETYLNYVRELGLPEDEYIGENAKFIAIGKMDNSSNRLLEAEDFNDLFNNSEMRLNLMPKGTNQVQTVTVTFGNYIPQDILPVTERREIAPYLFTINIPYSLKERFTTPESKVVMKGMTFNSEHTKQLVHQMEQILLKEGVTANYSIYNMDRLLEESGNMIFIANVFAYTFIVMISLIAIANVFNTISTNIKMRRRELAMLRSVGISERNFQKMMNFECALYGFQALLVGLPISIFISWLIYKGINEESIDFMLPWGSIGISIISVLLIVFMTMLYAIQEVKKENIIDALRDELT